MRLVASILLLSLLASTWSMVEDDPFPGEDYEADFIELSPGDEMFYWLFKSRDSPDQDPLVVWLTGGPGCSSQFAAFYENGPFKINSDLTLTKNEYSWNEVANVLYIDQPLGTGFSSTNKPTHYARSEKMVAEYFYTFLLKFYEMHPEYVNRPFYITGESYAGHYIPAISEYIINEGNPDINLISSAIGNGWVDPYLQYPQYLRFAKEHALVSSLWGYFLEYPLAVCEWLVKHSISVIDFAECEVMSMGITGFPLAPYFNPYDIREGCDKPPLCYDSSDLEKFLALPKVREALKIGNRKWSDCSTLVSIFMLADFTKDYSLQVKRALESNVGILVYSGDKDYICNWRGGEAWTNHIVWENQTQFQNSEYTPWTIDSIGEVGEYKKKDKFTFLKIYDAGHMVPMNQPAVALEMLKKFIAEEF